MDAVVGVFQHLRHHPFHIAVAIFGEVARNSREQRLEKLELAQLDIGAVAVARLQQFQRLFKQARRRDIAQQRGEARDRFGGFRRDSASRDRQSGE